MINITDKRKCTGCTACMSICGKRCISMKEDEEGFLYPAVDIDNCVDCGLCEKICPVLNPFEEKKDEPQCFAGRSNQKEIVEKSSSGGLFSVIARSVLNEGGVVVGAAFREDWSVHHIIIDSLDKLELLQGSKYVQSNLEDVFVQVKKHIKEGRKVFFVGTPCQVAGINHFIGKDENLLTADLICHSSPSPKVWKEYLETITKKYGGLERISRLTFRDKSLGWRKYSLLVAVRNNNSEVVLTHGGTNTNLYMRGFSQGLYNRPSCSQCPARNFKSGSDITLGDCWAVEKYYPQFKDDEKGLSVILVNSEKGLHTFENVKKEINYFEMLYEEVEPRDMHASLTRSTRFHPNREKFFKMSKSIPIDRRIYRSIRFIEIKNGIVIKVKNLTRKILGSRLYNITKKIYHG